MRRCPRVLHGTGFTVAFGFCLVAGLASARSLATGTPPPRPDERLDRILRLTKAYCARIDKAAFDFVCLEDIKEELAPLSELGPEAAVLGFTKPGTLFSYRTPQRGWVRTFVYDYQFIRKAGQGVENRTLIERDGRTTKEPDASLQTHSIRVQNALFGPTGLFSADRQPGHEYVVAGEETADGKTVLLVDVVPRSTAEPGHAVGRAWILEEDASILKIEWDQASVGGFLLIQNVARKLNAAPQLLSTTEYGVEKNGIRFPSRDTTEEAYILQDKKRVVRAKTSILYRDYKFFTVETEVDIRR